MAKAIIVYTSRSGNTEMMAKAIGEGLKEAGVRVISEKIIDVNADDLANFDAIVLGSPTYVHNLVSPMKSFLFKMENVDLKGKVGAAFGSYGWSGESVEMMISPMKHIFEMDVIEPGLRIKRRPDKNGLEQCKEFAKKIADKIAG